MTPLTAVGAVGHGATAGGGVPTSLLVLSGCASVLMDVSHGGNDGLGDRLGYLMTLLLTLVALRRGRERESGGTVHNAIPPYPNPAYPHPSLPHPRLVGIHGIVSVISD